MFGFQITSINYKLFQATIRLSIMDYIKSHDFKKIILFFWSKYKILNLTLKELKSVEKSRNLEGDKRISRKKLINVINKGKLLPTPSSDLK